MSKQIHDETQRRKQVKFRADESLVDQFDDAIDGSRAEALRDLMKEAVDEPQNDGKLDVPNDSDLAEAYRWLVRRTQRKGKDTVRMHAAKRELSQQQGTDKRGVRSELLTPLENRGYIHIQDAPPGNPSDGCIYVREIRREA